MTTFGWVLTLVGLAVGLGAVAWWVSGAPVVEPAPGCPAIHPVLKTMCDRGLNHDATDVHRDWHGQVWFEDEDPYRDCHDDQTDWEGRPWASGR